MHLSILLAAGLAVASAKAVYIGFNYGSKFTDGSSKQQSDFEAEFNKAKSLQGTNGEFTSARLYTTIQGGTTNTPISAIPAAIDTQTTLLLGLWASAGQADFSNELTALTSAIDQYGTAFTDLIAGISVGSEDLYRNSPTGIEANGYNAGAQPSDIVSFIGQLRTAISTTSASGASIGHVDTDAYPYYQTTISNGIDVANSTFYNAYDATVDVAQAKPVWVTETGWPVSGPQENQAIASTQDAETYWQNVACSLFGKINTWWFILQDAAPTTPSPSFGIIGSDLSSAPLYNLTCSNGNTAASSALSSASSSAVSIASSATAPTSSAGPNTETVTQTTLGVETSPASVSISQTSASSATSSVTQASTSMTPSVSFSATSSSATTSAAASSTTCPASLAGGYQYPHLIVPVNSAEPDTAYGNQYNGTISPSISTIFNFDVPRAYAGQKCSLVFLLPEQTETSSYTFNGRGGISVNELSSPATEQTTYATVPSVTVAEIGTISSLQTGNGYVVASYYCASGKTQSFEFRSIGGLDLEYFQNTGPNPLGAYMTVC